MRAPLSVQSRAYRRDDAPPASGVISASAYPAVRRNGRISSLRTEHLLKQQQASPPPAVPREDEKTRLPAPLARKSDGNAQVIRREIATEPVRPFDQRYAIIERLVYVEFKRVIGAFETIKIIMVEREIGKIID